MTIRSLAAIAFSGLFLSTTAQAVDAWQGTKFAYSTSSQLEYAVKVELGQNQKGSLVSKDGSTAITYQEVNDTVEMTPMGEISVVSFPFKIIEETGEGLQVEMISKLKKMVLSGNNTFEGTTEVIEVNETWESCYEYPLNGQTVQKCETNNTVMDEEIVLKDEMKSVGMMVQAGDNVVLPVPGFDSIFVKLKADTSVELLASGKAFEGQQVSSWKLDGESLVLTLADGATINYIATQNMESISRVVGIYKKDANEQTMMGALAIDNKIDAGSFATTDVEGKYKTVLASTNSTQDTLYEFNSNGFGGFDFSSLGETFNTVWAWELDNGLIKATRYRNQDGFLVNTEEEVEACMAVGSGCTIHQTRSYKILGKTGNRYTMMRTLTFKSDTVDNNDLSVWVFYKQ